jgi:predicted GIY-YIG superfamily endonuclease
MRKLHHIVYVIELDPSVLSDKKFRAANPRLNPRLPCLYVGSTGLTANERFKNHRNGHKSNRYVRNYSIRLLSQMYAQYPVMTWEDAVKKEQKLAGELRGKGYAVWQH